MKNLMKYWQKCYGYLLAGILTVLGFYGCTFQGAEEYGMPHVRYQLKGKVINEKEEAVPGVRITVGESLDDNFDGWYHNKILYTDTNGEFNYLDPYASSGYRWLGVKWEPVSKDIIDIYKTDSITVDMGKPTGGSGNWYEGEASKEIIIILKEKTTEEETQ